MQGYRIKQLFDGECTHHHVVLCVSNQRIQSLHPADQCPLDPKHIEDLGTGLVAPGFIDLQVNGGGGLMLGDIQTVDELRQICQSHSRMGTTQLLPTLITDKPATTARILELGIAATRAQLPGFAGLHLEGPHLDPRKKGAHNANLIRRMTETDLRDLIQAKQHLRSLLITVAPEAVSLAQIKRLHDAGIKVSLGHTQCTATEALEAFDAGASGVTHLYNAMSALQNRAPGMVGAALNAEVFAGIIADRVHVDEICLRIALRLKAPEHLFLVTDAMAVAGTHIQQFTLDGRHVRRQNGRLLLEDGTLAGADISLVESLHYLTELGLDFEQTLRMVTQVPAHFIQRPDLGTLKPGALADWVLFDAQNQLQGVWQLGQRIQ